MQLRRESLVAAAQVVEQHEVRLERPDLALLQVDRHEVTDDPALREVERRQHQSGKIALGMIDHHRDARRASNVRAPFTRHVRSAMRALL